ncbi:cysteine synthase family protein [Streptomyces sp. PTM05]|uniref:Cysteine synthase family protein n=1 Tax=Streptantibioticus parmotrematis TaxID=2873249 RepID=A0ABS7QUX7_9ACTN|nr:pyridoxal-phosphate dependent enzyme [Streptantibioticus parmotrematis]MBY8887018.1 cysteine synthase family protein [Streptantibioticus parmotrematis]
MFMSPTGVIVAKPEEFTYSWPRRAETDTPLRRLDMKLGSRRMSLWLKLECFNPTGSVKFRTALALLRALDHQRPLVPGTTVVESTSGNLGLALAHLCAELDCHFVAVVDPRLPSHLCRAMSSAGAEVITVHDLDERGGYLLSRLRTVREMCESRGTRWTNQYGAPANPHVHRDMTGVEIVRQTGGLLDALFVAVSTGGTLAGISERLRADAPGARLVAVDVAGSHAIAPDGHSPQLLTGIGATRASSFLRPHHYDDFARVSEVEAIALCRILAEDTGLALGGSSGAVLSAFVADARRRLRPFRCPVLLCPDGAIRYRDTVYSDRWLKSKARLGAVTAAMASSRRAGLEFALAKEERDVSP